MLSGSRTSGNKFSGSLTGSLTSFFNFNKFPHKQMNQTFGVTGFTSYIQDRIKELNKSYEENWGEINIYKYILNLFGFINNYINYPTKDNFKIVDWYFIDLIINKDRIIVRGIFYDLGLYIEDEIVVN